MWKDLLLIWQILSGDVFDKLEERANKNPEGLLFRTGTYILPLLGKFAETYLDIFDSRELMDNAYKKNNHQY